MPTLLLQPRFNPIQSFAHSLARFNNTPARPPRLTPSVLSHHTHMFAEINTALRWEHGEAPRGLVIVTEATPADATFMLLHFVGMYATDGTRRLCFVELRRTLESLAPLAKKLGITVRSEIENQGIVVVASPIVSDAETFELRVDVAALERELACAFERATAEQRALCIVLDDLSALLNVAATPLEVVHLLQRLQARMAGSKVPPTTTTTNGAPSNSHTHTLSHARSPRSTCSWR